MKSISSQKLCEYCSSPFESNHGRSKYCSTRCRYDRKRDAYGKVQDASSYEAQKSRGLERKLYFINLKGGKCEICGYNKNYSALCFHHIIPSEKEKKLDSRHLSNSHIDSLITEVNKCQLLCSNCHAEVHHSTNLLTEELLNSVEEDKILLQKNRKKRLPKSEKT